MRFNWTRPFLCRLCIVWTMKSSLILGYGSTGQDIEKYLLSKKEKYFIYDDNKTIPQDLNFRLEDITNVETLFVSPGIRKNQKPCSQSRHEEPRKLSMPLLWKKLKLDH